MCLAHVLEGEGRTILDNDILELGQDAVGFWLKSPDGQGAEEAAKHLSHELGKGRSSEAVVEGLVGRGRTILEVELAEQVRDALDSGASHGANESEDQAIGSDNSKPLTLPGRPSQLVDVID